MKSLSRVQLSATPWTAACQAPLSMGSPRQEYWSGLLCPPSAGLPNPGIKPTSLSLLHWQGGSLPLEPPGKLRWLLKIRPKKKKVINLEFRRSLNLTPTYFSNIFSSSEFLQEISTAAKLFIVPQLDQPMLLSTLNGIFFF